jgi:transcriptional regulator with XRE-family HTH domain
MYKERISSCAERLSTALHIRRMKQSELCHLAKIPKSSLSQYLSGDYEPKQDRISAISKVLNVSEAWLMGYDVPMERQKNAPSDESDLSEGEKLWLELYNKVSDETKEVMIKMMDSFDRIPKDKQQFVLQMIRVALGNQE